MRRLLIMMLSTMVSVSRTQFQDLRLRFGSGWDGAYPKARSLRELPLFAQCSRTELQTLVGLTSEVVVRAGTVLCRAGQGPAQFMILSKGRLEVSSNGASPHRCLPGSYLPTSGTHLYVTEIPTIRAESDVEVIVMNVSEFATMIELVPSVRARLSGTSPDEVVSAPAPSTSYMASPAGVTSSAGVGAA
jgi:CRP-like cAMP-binding protein